MSFLNNLLVYTVGAEISISRVHFSTFSCNHSPPIVLLEDPADALTDGRRFFFFFPKISPLMAPFILTLIQISRSVLFAEKQPQIRIFPLPITVGFVFSSIFSPPNMASDDYTILQILLRIFQMAREEQY